MRAKQRPDLRQGGRGERTKTLVTRQGRHAGERGQRNSGLRGERAIEHVLGPCQKGRGVRAGREEALRLLDRAVEEQIDHVPRHRGRSLEPPALAVELEEPCHGDHQPCVVAQEGQVARDTSSLGAKKATGRGAELRVEVVDDLDRTLPEVGA